MIEDSSSLNEQKNTQGWIIMDFNSVDSDSDSSAADSDSGLMDSDSNLDSDSTRVDSDSQWVQVKNVQGKIETFIWNNGQNGRNKLDY